MDITQFAVSETGILHLRDANDEPMVGEDGQPMTITGYGPGSREYNRAQAAQQNRLIRKLQRKGKTDETAEQKIREQAEFLADCTKEFSSNIMLGDLKGRELFLGVYQESKVGFIAEQFNRWLNDWANFKQPSAKS